MKTWRVALAVTLALAGCGGGGGGGGSESPQERTIVAQTVSFVVPSHNAVGVATTTVVVATFSEAKDASTLTPETFSIARVAGTVHYDAASRAAEFWPHQALAPNTRYTVTVSRSVKDPAGNPMPADYVWSFTTGAGPEAASPSVVSVDAKGFPGASSTNSAVSVTFSEPLIPSTVNTDTVVVTRSDGQPVAGSVAYDGKTATFTPNQELLPNTTYTVTVTSGAVGVSGNPVAGQVAGTITTGVAADETAPRAVATVPAPNDVDVPVNRAVAVNFSEPMAPASLTTGTFTLAQGGLFVPGTVACVGSTALFFPNAPLTQNANYRVTIAPEVRDLAGTPLAAAAVWDFTTGVHADTTAPAVLSTVPENNAIDVPVTTAITSTWSEPMNPFAPATVDGVPATVRYDFALNTFALVPAANLQSNAQYQGILVAEDLAGNRTVFPMSFATESGN